MRFVRSLSVVLFCVGCAGTERSDGFEAPVPDSGPTADPSDGGVDQDRDGGPVPGIDLAAIAVSTPSIVAPGQTIDVAARIENQGAMNSPASVLRLSLVPADLSSPPQDVLDLWLPELDSSRAYTATVALAIPSNVAPGPHVLRVVVNPEGTIAEFDTRNNTLDSDEIAISEVDVAPTRIELEAPVGCSQRAELRLENLGAASTTIDQIDFTTTSTALTIAAALPVPLAAGETASFEVTFAPDAMLIATGEIRITHARYPGSLRVDVSGVATTRPTQHDQFVQDASEARDILVLVDDSASMLDSQIALANAFDAFLMTANAEGMDYQIAATTTDVTSFGARGAFIGDTPIITPNTPNGRSKLEANLLPGTTGSPVEEGLRAVEFALSEPHLSGPNAGFLRPGAALVVVFLSDEDDQSPELAEYYSSYFAGLSGPASVTAHGIIGPLPSGCLRPDGLSAREGTRYAEVARALGGTTVSICSPSWAVLFDELLVRRNRIFELRSAAWPETIDVVVDGQTIAPGEWTYDPEALAIEFAEGSAPAGGAQVSVTYDVDCTASR